MFIHDTLSDEPVGGVKMAYSYGLTAMERLDLGHKLRERLRTLRESGFKEVPVRMTEEELQNLIIRVADDEGWGPPSIAFQGTGGLAP